MPPRQISLSPEIQSASFRKQHRRHSQHQERGRNQPGLTEYLFASLAEAQVAGQVSRPWQEVEAEALEHIVKQMFL